MGKCQWSIENYIQIIFNDGMVLLFLNYCCIDETINMVFE